MKYMSYRFLAFVFGILISSSLLAKENTPFYNQGGNKNNKNINAGCAPASAQTDLDINNVRTTILAGGDMWWDLISAQYEIPKGSGKHAIFAGSLWIGGIDAGGTLRVAAMTYRQTGNDFWPGPLDTTTTSIEASVCSEYDKHFKIELEQVEALVEWQTNGGTYQMPQVIEEWPGNGDETEGQAHFLAPFHDTDGDGFYDPSIDFPDYSISAVANVGRLYGDQTIWWVFNDKGNVHSETSGEPIGIEIRAQAFAFATNDAINDMTFYNYEIINRSTITLGETYFGIWVDPDLGDAFDDYVGCDVERGLGYCYNGDNDDGTAAGYGSNPPAIGMDFFQGPLADPNDGIDNDRDSLIDEPNEQIIMSKFVYYDNDWSSRGNPSTATHYYNYLKGIWKDGTSITYGGNGYQTGSECDFMFPDDSDPYGWGTDGITQDPWSEESEGNTPADRRFLQSAGEFTLLPGAVNTITCGLVFASSGSGGNTGSLELLKLYDDYAQALFDNNFQLLDGPPMPEVQIVELDKEIIINFVDTDDTENYSDTAKKIVNEIVLDIEYKFQGYQIYQLKDNSVSATDLYNIERARLVHQCDIEDEHVKIVNFYHDGNSETDNGQLMVEGENKGIVHSFSIKKDMFASGNSDLVNHQKYYYMVVPYSVANCTAEEYAGLTDPYVATRRVEKYTGIPHFVESENHGTNQNALYDDGVFITRIEGQGNGGNILDLSEASVNSIMSGAPHRIDNPQYKLGTGPLNIKIVDPLNVKLGTFTVYFSGVDSADYWYAVNEANETTPSYQATGVAMNFTDFVLDYVSKPTNMNTVKDGYRYLALDNSWNNIGYIYEYDATLGSFVETVPTTGMAVYCKDANKSGDKGLYVYNGNVWSHYADAYMGDKPIYYNTEKVISDWGLSFSIQQQDELSERNATDFGYLESTIEYADNNARWLSFVQDYDLSDQNFYFYLDWIASGTNKGFDFTSGCGRIPVDPVDYEELDKNEIWESVLDGAIAPYFAVCSNTSSEYNLGDGKYTSRPKSPNGMGNSINCQNYSKSVSSVDIVFTSDTTKWTRCVVLEMCEESELSEGNASKFTPRKHKSVYRNGAVMPTDEGRGWFPGYAIDVETGQRLNMMFGEDSWLTEENGNDMVWNPTNRDVTETGQLLFGGKHYFFVVGSAVISGKSIKHYDEGAQILDIFNNGSATDKAKMIGAISWTGMPMVNENYLFDNPMDMPSDIKIRIRVAKPYKNDLWAIGGGVAANKNNNNPMFTFTTSGVATETNVLETAENALENVRVVPNPYYAYSSYEENQLDNRVKITNIPTKCEINIYTINGTLVRSFNVDKTGVESGYQKTSIDWDLRNDYNIPVLSGMYLIHVKAEGVGETVVKWFGSMRPIDLDSF